MNNRDITDKVTFYDNYFIYEPNFILDGKYNVDVMFVDKYNRELPIFRWNFTVISKDKLAGLSTLFSHSGKISNNYSVTNAASEELVTNNLNLDYKNYLKLKTSKIIYDTTEAVEVFRGNLLNLSSFLLETIVLLIIISFLIYLNPLSTLVTILILTLLSLLEVRKNQRKLEKLLKPLKEIWPLKGPHQDYFLKLLESSD